MPLTTTEVPTFFGPSDSPLFGVVHLPVDNLLAGGATRWKRHQLASAAS